jgi:hypothetical protein
MDVHKAVGLCDGLFNSDHDRFIDHLNFNPLNQLKYVSKLIELNGDSIRRTMLGQGSLKTNHA